MYVCIMLTEKYSITGKKQKVEKDDKKMIIRQISE